LVFQDFLLWFAMPVFAQTSKISRRKEQLDHTTDDSSKVEISVQLAEKLKQSGNIQQSLTPLGKAGKLADSLKSAHLIQLADNYLDSDQPDSAERIINRALNKYPNTNKETRC